MSEAFWNTVLTASRAVSLREKYAWMRRIVLQGPGSAPSAPLREAARRWPGSLRECQLVAPAVYRARAEALAEPGADDRSFRWWRARGHAAVCLWSELHELHRDLLGWRAGGPDDRSSGQFLRDLTVNDPSRRAAWPVEAVVDGWAMPRAGARLAERCLAHRSGLEPGALALALRR